MVDLEATLETKTWLRVLCDSRQDTPPLLPTHSRLHSSRGCSPAASSKLSPRDSVPSSNIIPPPFPSLLSLHLDQLQPRLHHHPSHASHPPPSPSPSPFPLSPSPSPSRLTVIRIHCNPDPPPPSTLAQDHVRLTHTHQPSRLALPRRTILPRPGEQRRSQFGVPSPSPSPFNLFRRRPPQRGPRADYRPHRRGGCETRLALFLPFSRSLPRSSSIPPFPFPFRFFGTRPSPSSPPCFSTPRCRTRSRCRRRTKAPSCDWCAQGGCARRCAWAGRTAQDAS